MSKRANGEGQVRQRPNGSWEARLSYLDGDGSRRRVSVYAPTAAECRNKLKDLRKRLDAGQPAKDTADTVAVWMKRWRETSLAASDRKATTKQMYGNLSRKHIEAGAIGDMRLDKLKPTDVERLVVKLRADGLSDSTVRSVYAVLRAGLDVAVRDGLLGVNPATKVKRPTVARREARYLTSDEVARLLDAAQGLRHHLAVTLMAVTGMRRGEVAGLLWSAVNFNKGELTVQYTLARVEGVLVLTEPKTARSRRRIPIPAGMVTQLKAHRAAQAAERLKAGDQWVDSGAVFTTELGGLVDPRNMLRTVELAAQKAGIENVGAHTIRHSAAVAWLEGGVHIKAAADLLGHSSIAVTGDLYGHTSDDTARAAVDGLGKAFGL